MPQPDSHRVHPRSGTPFISLTLVGLLVLSVWTPRSAAAQSKGKFLKDVAVAALGVLAAKKVKQSWDERQLRQAEDALDAEADPFRDCMLSLGEAPATQTQQTAVDKMLADLQYQRRLAKEEAEDIAYTVLIDICEAHAKRPYENLVGAFL